MENETKQLEQETLGQENEIGQNKGLDSESREALKAELREEVRAEIREEMKQEINFDRIVGKEKNKPVNHHMWRRFFARVMDQSLIGIISVTIFMLGIKVNLLPASILASRFQMLVFNLPFLIIIEAIVLSVFGTTFGKWLLKLRVVNFQGSKLSFGQALHRTARVYLFGEALNIPLLTLLANLYWYFGLRDTGMTNWDSAVDTEVIALDEELDIRIMFYVIIAVVNYIVLFTITSYFLNQILGSQFNPY